MKQLLLSLVVILPLAAQNMGLLSPEVQSDRRVTFRVKAPEAQKVELALEGTAARKPMTKGADGVWTLTTDPLDPDIYGYTFNIDSVGFVDPSNGMIKPNALSVNSAVLVPGQPPMPWEQTNVAHGTVHHHFYESKVVGDKRDFYVYTPPNYDAKKTLPLMVLLHGFSDYANGWSAVGKANLILDNLISEGKVKPMIVIMPLGYGVPIDMLHSGMRPDPKFWSQNGTKFGEALLQEVIPMAEKSYKIDKNRSKRAIVGLSMGGGESLQVGLNNLDKFAYVGAFSAGGGQDRFEETFPKLSDKDNARVKLLWIACGKDDRLVEPNKKFVEWLNSKQIHNTWVETPGAHTWLVWRRYLSDFSQLLKW